MSGTPQPSAILDELRWRGMLYQSTDEAALRDHLARPRRVYIGFDPTSDSLTIGNLVQIMVLRRFQLCGHTPVVVMGGGTGLIGDPSGKTSERQLLDADRVAANVEAQKRIFRPLLRWEGPNSAIMFNNLDWLGKLGYLELLRDVGKHFSVNMMVQKESIRARLEDREHGISYTEFSYMILQSYDYYHLWKHHGVTVQCGGSDQWGNIVAGADLIRRMTVHAGGDADSHHAHALTTPLVTKADGGKFGKTESGAIWLTADRTSPYAYYQFWLNAADADAVKFLKLFTDLSQPEIAALEQAHAAAPEKREAQRALARAATALLHGTDAVAHAEAAAAALFSGDVARLDAATLREVFANVPATDHDRSLLSGEGIPLVDLLPRTSLAKSKTEARQHLSAGAVSINGGPPASPDARLRTADLLHGEMVLLRRGKKAWHVTRWT